MRTGEFPGKIKAPIENLEGAVTISIDAEVRSLRVVVGALIMGLIMLSGIVVMMAPLSQPPDEQLGRMMLGGLGLIAVACGGAYYALRLSLTRDLAARAAELSQSAEPAALILPRYRQFAIAGAGLIDGPGLVAGVTYLMTANPLALGVMAAVVLLLLAHMPSADSLRRLAETAATGQGG